MISLIKRNILKYNQASIHRLKPKVNILLSKEIPLPSQRLIKKTASLVSLINSLEPKISRLSDKELREKTTEFKEKLFKKEALIKEELFQLEAQIEESTSPEEKARLKENLKVLRNSIFEEILPEAFAVVREAAKRTLGQRHFDVQILGGYFLHQGKIIEMATGEGKTLVATLAAYLNALLGRGVHIVTVNDYLARRDRDWMGPIYEFLGLSVGVIQHDMGPEERRYAYNCDITYGTNNEFGFDYLRDNMAMGKEEIVQRPFYYAIVDEVDSILIDEARTPLIISGPAEESTDKYYIADRVARQLRGRLIQEEEEINAKMKGMSLSLLYKGYDYIIDPKNHTVSLTEEGEAHAAKLLGVDNLHELDTMEWRHHILQALRAHADKFDSTFFKKDVHYVVKDGQVIIVDEFTGRLMPGRRWSDGLHQAIEAKEGLKIERENQTLATITFQNYFRLYEKLAGMTGTAYTEAQEFKSIYGLDVVVIPTNRPLIRTNYPDCVYKTEKEKFQAIVEEISSLYKQGRPVLVGTISIEKSERLSEMLRRRGIPHQVLNAKYHELEAQIVAQAGRLKTVTIATNMAGRGTDILLGGNAEYMAKNLLRQKKDGYSPEEYNQLLEKLKKQVEEEHKKVVQLGGLHVIGTERHEARRIDNQLRGRAGRQGDPGSSRFYVSLEDDLMRLFGSDRLIGIMDRLGMQEGQVIEHPWVTKSIEIAQKRVETHNFEIRKQLLEFDNVMNKQREVIYAQRRMILEGKGLKEYLFSLVDELIDEAINRYLAEEVPASEWDWQGLFMWIKTKFGYDLESERPNFKDLSCEQIKHQLLKKIDKFYQEKEATIGKEQMHQLQKIIMLKVIDSKWKDHLYAMDYLKEGIGLRAYGHRDPIVEYQHEAFSMFSEMVSSIKEEIAETIFKVQALHAERIKGVFSSLPQQFIHPQVARFRKEGQMPAEQPSLQRTPQVQFRASRKIGRNQPCPCGSGKKYKRCCGR